ncbi:DUF1365 domain-containing protein [Burkholderia sp. Ac-20379]|uniref:DUF1365 domain-containing protein n=1 Tax=Burkholderia sp. Ac-20379 TaxID=2703900 RepID=UPI00197DCA1E|nr:DUF1365 domain-containing protein [Burkholderia sp. Ac-20379]MBN3726072.1 DUF1365 domain-containing protein [Burkholderia sp. Ac-20379]
MTDPARAPAQFLTGRVMHERLRPARHRFDYPVLYLGCDVARLADIGRRWFGVDRRAPLAIATRDFGPRDGQPLAPWMRARLDEAGIPADGEIRLVSMPRVFGRAFNPVGFWLCHDRSGALRALYADVRNTFGGHHGYLLSAPGHAPIEAATELVCRKAFHVSPFCEVTGRYVFRVREHGDRLAVAIDYHDDQGLLLRTALTLRAQPFTGQQAWRALARQPFDIVGVLFRIHWQALRLWLKRVPFHGAQPPSRPSPPLIDSTSSTPSTLHDRETSS